MYHLLEQSWIRRCIILSLLFIWIAQLSRHCLYFICQHFELNIWCNIISVIQNVIYIIPLCIVQCNQWLCSMMSPHRSAFPPSPRGVIDNITIMLLILYNHSMIAFQTSQRLPDSQNRNPLVYLQLIWFDGLIIRSRGKAFIYRHVWST